MMKKVGFLEDESEYSEVKSTSDEIGKLLKKLRNQLDPLSRKLTGGVGDDPVSRHYRKLFAGCVRDIVMDASLRSEFAERLEKRFRLGRPPGYKDREKDDSGSGDLLIWETILAEAKARAADVIFVTGDEKSDWFVQLQGGFQPRIELLEEFRTETNGRTLHILQLSQLLKTYGAEEKIVSAVRHAEESQGATRPPKGNRIRRIHMSRTYGILGPTSAQDLVLERDRVLEALLQVTDELNELTGVRDAEGASGPDRDSEYRLATVNAEITRLNRHRDHLVRRLAQVQNWLDSPPEVASTDEGG